MDAAKLLADGTIKATGLILRDRGIDPLNHVDELTEATKATLKENLSEIMAEWKEATDAFMSEAWLRKLVNAQCNEMALKVVERINL